MSMVCPRCNTSFEERYHCPACGIPLVAMGPTDGGSAIYGRPKWQQTTWGRLAVGLLLAQGLYYGLWQLSTAAVLALGEEPNRGDWWGTSTGWALLQVMLAVSLVGGGMMAGAGQKRGALYGAILGLANGLIYLVSPKGRPLSTLELYGQPLFQMVCGMVGAWAGSMIWKPMLPIVAAPSPGTTPPPFGRLQLKAAPPPEASFLAGPVNWVRVIAGMVLAVLGSAWANLILKWILESGAGFSVQSVYHARFVTWEISLLALLLGAGLAGSNSRNGAKQGLLVGIGVCAGLIGLAYQSGGKPPAPTVIFDLLGLSWNINPMAQMMICTCVTVLPLSLIGGWFGSQLLPPLAPYRRKDQIPTWV